uniref:hypothetical protein n=1 Tax=Enterobacter cloacae TaxID=550 RepID=UPI001953BF6E
MRKALNCMVLIAAMASVAPAIAQDHARPNPVLREVVEGMPRGEKQEVHVMTAHFLPGQSTVFH